MKLAIKLNVAKKTFKVIGAFTEYELRKAIEELESLGFKWED